MLIKRKCLQFPQSSNPVLQSGIYRFCIQPMKNKSRLGKHWSCERRKNRLNLFQELPGGFSDTFNTCGVANSFAFNLGVHP